MILMVTKFGVAVGRVTGSRYLESLNFDERVIFEGLIETLLFSWKILILVSGYWSSSLICLVCSRCVGMGIAMLRRGPKVGNVVRTPIAQILVYAAVAVRFPCC